MWRAFLFICFAGALSASANAQTAQELQWCIKGGQKHAGLTVKNPPSPEQTVRGCSAVIRGGKLKGVQLASAYTIRGVTHALLKKLDEAVQDYDAALRLTPNSFEVLNLRGMVQVERGEVERGLQDIKSAIQKNPKFVVAYYNLGTTLVQRDQVDAGIEALDQTIKKDPKLGQAYLNRGWAYAKKGDYDRAIEDATVAIRLMPMEVRAYINRSAAFQQKGAFGKAEDDISQALKLDDKNAVFWNDRCWVRALGGRELDGALNDCNRSLALQPNTRHALDSRAMVYLKMDRNQEALADYDAALHVAGYEPGVKVAPELATTLYGRGIARKRQGDQLGAAVDMAAARAAKSTIAEEFERYGVR